MSLKHAIVRLLQSWTGVGGHQVKMSPRNVIFISGCDSGLGFSLAMYCHNRLNMTVVSACHNVNSAGAKKLQHQSDPKRMITIHLDLLKPDTIKSAHRALLELLDASNGEYVLTALVNNAGVMCFGEFEWQTRTQIESQINVNILGTISLTKELLPLLRRQQLDYQHQARIINITSHCSLQALPALSLYVASKAALRYWNDALRLELRQYGIEVISFLPGSFVQFSNIAARQPEHAHAQFQEFDAEQRNFYGEYFKRFNEHLSVLGGFKEPDQMQDEQLLEKFRDALTSQRPHPLYKHEPWRYKMYHLLFRWCPTALADWLTVKFCAMPTYVPDNTPAALRTTTNGHTK